MLGIIHQRTPVLQGNLGNLGDFRSDLVSKLAIVLGQAKAEEVVTGFENLIKQRAKEGAQAAIPEIKTEVKATVIPLVAASIATSVAAAALSIMAIRRAKRS